MIPTIESIVDGLLSGLYTKEQAMFWLDHYASKSDHFNQLSPAQLERLAILAEECGEVIQVVGKTIRHGYRSVHPDSGKTNNQRLEEEIGDTIAAVNMLVNGDDLNEDSIEEAIADKYTRLEKYTHHQDWTSNEH